MSGRKRTDGLSGETEDEDGVADQHLKNKGEVCDPVSSYMAIDADRESAGQEQELSSPRACQLQAESAIHPSRGYEGNERDDKEIEWEKEREKVQETEERDVNTRGMRSLAESLGTYLEEMHEENKQTIKVLNTRLEEIQEEIAEERHVNTRCLTLLAESQGIAVPVESLGTYLAEMHAEHKQTIKVLNTKMGEMQEEMEAEKRHVDTRFRMLRAESQGTSLAEMNEEHQQQIRVLNTRIRGMEEVIADCRGQIGEMYEEIADCNEQIATQTQALDIHKRSAAQRRFDGTLATKQADGHCYAWQNSGICGKEGCKYAHAHAEQGYCRSKDKYGVCNRVKCPYHHDPSREGGARDGGAGSPRGWETGG